MKKQLHEYSLACAIYRVFTELYSDEEKINCIMHGIRTGYVDGRLDGIREASEIECLTESESSEIRMLLLKDPQ